jgi:hypothetical protein
MDEAVSGWRLAVRPLRRIHAPRAIRTSHVQHQSASTLEMRCTILLMDDAIGNSTFAQTEGCAVRPTEPSELRMLDGGICGFLLTANRQPLPS